MTTINSKTFMEFFTAIPAQYKSPKDKIPKNLDKHAEKVLEAVKFTIKGEGEIDGCNLNPSDIIALCGVGNPLVGNWLVIDVTTKLDKNGYNTDFTCIRDFIYNATTGDNINKSIEASSGNKERNKSEANSTNASNATKVKWKARLQDGLSGSWEIVKE